MNSRFQKGIAHIVLFVMVSFVMGVHTLQAAYRPPEVAPPRDLAIEMGAPFHDHAILQRDKKVPVWGWSKPGTLVTVEFAGQKKTATAGDDGKWMLDLDPLQASAEGREMVIQETGTDAKEVLRDILVGEVWMCSGQSNMQWLSGACIVGGKLIPEIKARVEAGKEQMPIIREVKVTNLFSSLYPSDRGIKGQWRSDWMNFSAISFAFAYEIARELQVPVGIVNGAFSTTKIEAWVPREGFAGGKDDYTRDIYQQILESDVNAPEHETAWAEYEKDLIAWAEESAERTKKGLDPNPRPGIPGNMNGNRDATWMCNGKIMPMAPYAIRGAIWNQGYASQGDGAVYRNNLHSLIRGWRAVFNQPDLPVYFHQFYVGKSGSDGLNLSGTSDMRLGTWLAHLDIPNAAMASQIDITGGIHYFNKAVPGQRLALHALKNQYQKDIVSNGPMFASYKVKGDKVIVALDHAEGLQVGQSMTISGGYADPVPLADAEDKVTMFYVADEDHVWHQAKIQISGESVIVRAEGVDAPRGVAYGWDGVGGLPSIYNGAMLPLTPFALYDHKLIVSGQWDLDYIKMPDVKDRFELMTWPMDYFKIAGVEKDPSTYGLQEEYRRLNLLSPQFANHAVIQAAVPTRLYGKAVPRSVVSITFGDFRADVQMGAEQDEWEVTVPPLPASAEPKTLRVSCMLDGELAHERELQNIVVGDVWYVAAIGQKLPDSPGVPRTGPAPLSAWEEENPQLRMFKSFAWGRKSEDMPSRFKMNASGKPDSRAFARWSPTIGVTKALAERIHAKTGNPVGIVIVAGDSKLLELKSWVGYEHLKGIPDWQPDVAELRPRYEPDPQQHIQYAKAYLASWDAYWKGIQSDPDFNSGAIPSFPGATSIKTSATKNYNQAVCSFSPGNFKAVLCLPGEAFVSADQGAGFGPKFSALANSWKSTFAYGKSVIDPVFIYAMPGSGLASAITSPETITGLSVPYKVDAWPNIANPEDLAPLLDAAIRAVYK